MNPTPMVVSKCNKFDTFDSASSNFSVCQQHAGCKPAQYKQPQRETNEDLEKRKKKPSSPSGKDGDHRLEGKQELSSTLGYKG